MLVQVVYCVDNAFIKLGTINCAHTQQKELHLPAPRVPTKIPTVLASFAFCTKKYLQDNIPGLVLLTKDIWRL